MPNKADLKEIHQYVVSSGSSERHQNTSVSAVTAYARSLMQELFSGKLIKRHNS